MSRISNIINIKGTPGVVTTSSYRDFVLIHVAIRGFIPPDPELLAAPLGQYIQGIISYEKLQEYDPGVFIDESLRIQINNNFNIRTSL